MNWLLHNPIADMPLCWLVVFWGCVAVVTLAICLKAALRRDPTLALSPVPVPSTPDPYEIAFLRGGKDEVAEAAIAGLTQRGYLRTTKVEHFFGLSAEYRIERALHPSESRSLSRVEAEVYGWFSTPRERKEILELVSGSANFKACCADYESSLRRQHLLTPPELAKPDWASALVGFAVIACLGGYRLLVELAKAEFELAICMGLLVPLFLILACTPGRLTHRGEKYLKQLEFSLADLRHPTWESSARPEDAKLALAVALFGLDVVKGTMFADLENVFAEEYGAGEG